MASALDGIPKDDFCLYTKDRIEAARLSSQKRQLVQQLVKREPELHKFFLSVVRKTTSGTEHDQKPLNKLILQALWSGAALIEEMTRASSITSLNNSLTTECPEPPPTTESPDDSENSLPG
jgi:hypothetical protein